MKLFRDEDGNIRDHLSGAEGPTFRENPLDFFILLARYKFAARLLDPDDDVLDAGSGHGIGSVFLRRFGRAVTGVDSDEELVAHSRSQYGDVDGLSFVTGDVTNLAALGRTWDAVVSNDVIEHLSLDDGRRMLESCRDVLNPGGLIVVGTPNANSSAYSSERRKLTHLHEYSHAELRTAMKDVFGRAMVFSMTDESVGTGFSELAWYFIGVAVRA